MNARTVFAVVAAVLWVAVSGISRAEEAKVGDYRITGPFVHENLTVYLIHGADILKGRTYLTLQEAMEQKKVIVHETGNVQELAIENISADDEVYVQYGDIVKGGRQDRTIACDFILPPKSGKTPIASFCVESSRWHGRGQESAAAFSKSDQMVVGKSMKLASNATHSEANQSAVWENVRENQGKMNANAGTNVTSGESPTSYQLTLENKKVQELTEQYIKELSQVAEQKMDAVGYAFAINGKMNSAEVYGNHALFMKMWSKLLRSAATEAFAEMPKDRKFDAAKIADVTQCIQAAEKGKTSRKEANARTRLLTHEADDAVLFETYDKAAPAAGGYLHRSYLAKERADHRAPAQPEQQAPNPAIQQMVVPNQPAQ